MRIRTGFATVTARVAARRLALGLGLAGALAAALPGAAGAQDEGIAIGEMPAPAALQTLEGDTVQLADLVAGKPALVEFWATWCPVCRALEPEVRAAHEEMGEHVVFLIVAVGVAQTIAQVNAHAARHPLPGTVLWDGRGAAVRAFEAPGTGFVVLLDRDGRVAYTGTGTDQPLRERLRLLVHGAEK